MSDNTITVPQSDLRFWLNSYAATRRNSNLERVVKTSRKRVTTQTPPLDRRQIHFGVVKKIDRQYRRVRWKGIETFVCQDIIYFFSVYGAHKTLLLARVRYSSALTFVWFFSPPGSKDNVDGLRFSSSVSSPDKLLGRTRLSTTVRTRQCLGHRSSRTGFDRVSRRRPARNVRV